MGTGCDIKKQPATHKALRSKKAWSDRILMKAILRIFTTLFCLLSLSSPALAETINISVAASLKEVIDELVSDFVKKQPAVKLIRNYGASGALAKQIENGAPADIFISANTAWMDYLGKNKVMDAQSSGIFAYNTLVFSGKATSGVSGMNDINKLNKIAIGSPKSVPAGEYAMEALKKAGIDKQLENKLVIARDVRACLMYSERGEVDGAFVYRTDALQARQAKILFSVPRELYTRVSYPMAMTLKGSGNADAKAFYNYLASKEAKKALKKYGFDLR